MRWIYLVLLLNLLLVANLLKSQQFGGHPAGQQWKQAGNDSLEVIFPSGQSLNAFRVIDLVGQVDNGFTGGSIKKFRKIPLVLQHKTNISNGYVGMGPWRSEFYLTPDQNSFELGSIPWIEQLTFHEYRHVQQYRHFMQGVTGIAYKILGQQAGVPLSNAAIPNWFWEGDAVWQETQYTNQGRGRIPAFYNGYRSLWNAQKNYSWMKLRNGSLRDYVPDHYELGYLLSSYGHDRYGKSFWNDVTSDAVRFKGIFYPFQKAISVRTGKSFSSFVQESFDYYKSGIETDSIGKVAGQRKHFDRNISFPQWLNDSVLIAVRSSYKKIPEFIKINTKNGSELKIATRYISLDRQFSMDGQHVVYAGWNTDRRWGFRDYHDIVLLDLNTGKQHFITHHKRYFSPDILNKRIIAVHGNESGSNELHLINAANGLIQKVLPNNDGYFYTYPKFLDEENIVSAVRDSSGKMTIVRINLLNGAHENIFPFSEQLIGFVSAYKGRISFTATSGKSEQAYVWEDGKLYRIDENAALGVYQPDEINGKWVMQGFSATGDQLIFANKKNQVENFEEKLSGPYPDLIHSIQRRNVESTLDSSKYHQGKNIFNFHSILPTISDPDYAISIISNNVLNNFISEINLQYNTNEQYKRAGIAFLYGGLYPWIRASVDYTVDRSFYTGNSLATWNEIEGRIGLQLPLNLTKGKSYRSLNIRMDYVYNDGKFTGSWKDSTDIESFGYINPIINISSRIQQARQHIYPRLGYNILLDYRKVVQNREGGRVLGNMFLFLPGIHQNHNLVLQTAYQWRSVNGVRFSNNFPTPRGYISEYAQEMFRLGVNYHFPIVYPDWGFGNLIYFLRLRGNAFYDFAQLRSAGLQKDFNSVGMEIFFDTKWWNQQNISFGFRISYPLQQQFGNGTQPVFDFVLPVNLFNR